MIVGYAQASVPYPSPSKSLGDKKEKQVTEPATEGLFSQQRWNNTAVVGPWHIYPDYTFISIPTLPAL